MSASLVGSEMCIRDSSPPAASIDQPLFLVCTFSFRPRRVRQPRRPMPVSYTHLTLPTICSV
eukprot:15053561-Alexandrium_andersonii.AAC.1